MDPSSRFEVAPVSTLLDFGWPDLTAKLVRRAVHCPGIIRQMSCCCGMYPVMIIRKCTRRVLLAMSAFHA